MALPLILLSLKVPVTAPNPSAPAVTRVETAALIKALPTLPPGFKPLDDGLQAVFVPKPKGPGPLPPAAARAAAPAAEAQARAADLQGALAAGARLFDGRVTTTRVPEPASEPVPAR